MIFILGGLLIVASIVMVLAVLIQNSKGGGINTAFGAAGNAAQMLGARRGNELIEQITWYLAIFIAILAVSTNIIGNMKETKSDGLMMQKSLEGKVGTTALPTFDNKAAKPAAEGAKPADAAQPAKTEAQPADAPAAKPADAPAEGKK
ncbi:MAG: preprotein translocase subunit SecG [Bacteroidia bacterium]